MARIGQATVAAPANIAFMKYWGNADHALRIPRHNSLSMNVTGAVTTTTVEFDDTFSGDSVTIDGELITGGEADRVSAFLDHVRRLTNTNHFAKVTSQNSFPRGAGIASSASAFAALALASVTALGLEWSNEQLSALARLGSGSASRSIPDGFVEWHAGSDHDSSHAVSLFPAEHWAIVDLITIVQSGAKEVGSTQGHQLADTSPLYEARVTSVPDRLDTMKKALAAKDWQTFGELVESESYSLHAIMMTSHPGILYWSPATVRVLLAVAQWRKEGVLAYCTIDAGANVHVLCQEADVARVKERLEALEGVERVIEGRPTHGARVIE